MNYAYFNSPADIEVQFRQAQFSLRRRPTCTGVFLRGTLLYRDCLPYFDVYSAYLPALRLGKIARSGGAKIDGSYGCFLRRFGSTSKCLLFHCTQVHFHVSVEERAEVHFASLAASPLNAPCRGFKRLYLGIPRPRVLFFWVGMTIWQHSSRSWPRLGHVWPSLVNPVHCPFASTSRPLIWGFFFPQ